MTTPVVDTLARLVAFPTVSDRPVVELAAYLAQRAEDAGFRVERFDSGPGKCNVVASAGPAGTDGLVLSGHMDVVPVDGQPWTTDPFRLVEREGRLYGRGSCDMKGFIAAVVEALSDARDLRRELVLVWTHDEETGCIGSARLMETLRAAGRALPSLAWVGEPTDFRICRLHPGHTWLRVTATGRPAHSARPDLGASAIKVARRALEALEDLEQALRAERAFEDDLPSPWPILNVAIVRGGTAVNIVPDRCAIDVGVRQLPGQSAVSVADRVLAALEGTAGYARSIGGAIAVELVHETPALLTPEGTPLQGLLAPHSSDPRPTGCPFATDGAAFAALGTAALVFGPGSIDVAHRPDEFVEAASLVRTVDIVRDVVARRCSAL